MCQCQRLLLTVLFLGEAENFGAPVACGNSCSPQLPPWTGPGRQQVGLQEPLCSGVGAGVLCMQGARVSLSLSSPPPPLRTPAPPDRTALTTPFGLNHPLKTLISKSAHILRSGELGPRSGDTVQPRRPEEMSSRGQL